MQSLLASAASAALCVVFAFFAVERACMLREEYLMQAIIIEKDRDFLSKCQTPEGYASMNHHPNFCEKILATARTGAFWHAVKRVAGSLPTEQATQSLERMGWKAGLVIAVLFLIMPSVFIKQARSRHDFIPYHCKELP
jgi:hypothetical protein